MKEEGLRCLFHRPAERLYATEGELAGAIASLPPGAIEEAGELRAAGGASRGPTRVLPLPPRAERAHVRRLRHGGLLAPLSGDRFLGWRRPLAELRVCEALRSAGAPVPQALLAHGARRGLFWRLHVGTLHIEDAVDGFAFVESAPDAATRIAVCAAAGAAIRRFHDAGGQHADLHAGNLLVRRRGDEFEVWVIDLDRARIGAAPTPERRSRELTRLYRSLRKRAVHERFGAREQAAFLGAYCGRDRGLRRALRRRIRLGRLSVRLHALRYSS